jgi:large subunit ribosomal protein L13
MKTFVPKKDDIERRWWLVNAEGKVLGRLATEIAEKITATGRKADEKIYHTHSQYPGGLKSQTLKGLLAEKPEEVIRRAVWGMIPKNKLGRQVFKKLKVYRGPDHPHSAQGPQEYRF